VIDNKPGGSTMVGTEALAKSPADGYTLVVATLAHAVNPSLKTKLPYSQDKDFAPVILVGVSPNVVVVSAESPYKTFQEFLIDAKANPGKLSYASQGGGTSAHLAGELFNSLAGTKLTHVPYKGGAASLAAVIAGEVDLSFTSLLSARAHIPMGRIRVLGITASKRSPVVPDIPTIAESGVLGFEANQWYGVITSAKVPMPIVNKLSAMIQGAVHSTDVVERLVYDGSIPVHSSSAEFKIHLATEISKWRKLIKEAGLNLN
jgi:tripartite-type tricarboxylate transporter receptor subunit TctC